MTSEIQPADPALRTKILAIMGMICLLAVAGVLSLDAYFKRLQDLAQHDVQLAAEKIRAVAEPILLGVGAGAIVAGLWASVTAVRILRGRRFPPRGMKVIRDTPIVTGRRATLRGVVGLALGMTLIFLGLRLPLRASRLLDIQLDTRPQPIPILVSAKPAATPAKAVQPSCPLNLCSVEHWCVGPAGYPATMSKAPNHSLFT